MLRTTCPNISIITNWGCDVNCWYCVWKNHPLKDIALKTDWIKLREFLYKYKDKCKVSVSGGGDCLKEFTTHRIWWNKLFDICNDLNIKVDVHSRSIIRNDKFWEKVNRCVMSSDTTDDVVSNMLYLFPLTEMRVTHVITKYTTKELIQKYIELCAELGSQLTFKELVGHDDGGNYKKFKYLFPEQYWLDSGDYNIYFFPDNTMGSDFMNPYNNK